MPIGRQTSVLEHLLPRQTETIYIPFDIGYHNLCDIVKKTRAMVAMPSSFWFRTMGRLSTYGRGNSLVRHLLSHADSTLRSAVSPQIDIEDSRC